MWRKKQVLGESEGTLGPWHHSNLLPDICKGEGYCNWEKVVLITVTYIKKHHHLSTSGCSLQIYYLRTRSTISLILLLLEWVRPLVGPWSCVSSTKSHLTLIVPLFLNLRSLVVLFLDPTLYCLQISPLLSVITTFLYSRYNTPGILCLGTYLWLDRRGRCLFFIKLQLVCKVHY